VGQALYRFSTPRQHQKTLPDLVNILSERFGTSKLTAISPDRIRKFIEERLEGGTGPATINRDIAVGRRMLNIAEKQRLIGFNPYREITLLDEKKGRRQPHILTFDEEDRILAVAPAHIRALAVLILETGMRSNREALALRWENVDFGGNVIRVCESKTRAGVRCVPLSARCKAELVRWRNVVGPAFSDYVFPNMRTPTCPLKDVRRSWAKALADAGFTYFWLYNLRHSFASRLSAAGVSDVFVAQMLGHSTPSILQTYARVIGEYRRTAIQKLETLRIAHESDKESSSASVN
jgi:integrase